MCRGNPEIGALGDTETCAMFLQPLAAIFSDIVDFAFLVYMMAAI